MIRAAALLLSLLTLAACGPSDEDIARNLSSPNPVVREDTAKIARNFGSDPVNAALLVALQDPSTTVRKNAVESLAELEVVSAAAPLAELLPVEPDPSVAASIIDALGRLKDPVAVPALVAWLEANPERPALNAIWALGNIGDASALDVLSRLRESRDVYVRYNATAALRVLRAPAEGAASPEGAPADAASQAPSGAPPAAPDPSPDPPPDPLGDWNAEQAAQPAAPPPDPLGDWNAEQAAQPAGGGTP